MTNRYTAWNGQDYEAPPPKGWYLAIDDRWWPPLAPVTPPPPLAGPLPPPPAPNINVGPPGATPKEQIKSFRLLKKRAKSLVAEGEKVLKQFRDASEAAEQQIPGALREYRQGFAQSQFDEVAIESLAELTPGRVSVKALRSAGINTAADVAKRGASITSLSGVGPKTWQALSEALETASAAAADAPVPLPKPGLQVAGSLELVHSVIKSEALAVLESDALVLSQSLVALRDAVRVADTIDSGRTFLVSKKRLASRAEQLGPGIILLLANLGAPPLERLEEWAGRLRSVEQGPPEGLIEHHRRNVASLNAKVEQRLYSGKPTHPAFTGSGVPKEVVQVVEQLELRAEGLNGTLRRYQEFGAKFLISQKRTLLGDEMGLGKTVQAIAAMLHMQATSDAQHFLVVCPASLIDNWEREIAKFSGLRTFRMHGPGKAHETHHWVEDGGVGITSYSTLAILDIPAGHNIQFLVADEAHYVKNPYAKRTQALAAAARQAEAVTLMTGTPLENRANEFVALAGLVAPEVAHRLGSPGGTQANPAAVVHQSAFKTLVAPIYLRRNQADVLDELPPLVEVKEWVKLTRAELVLADRALRTKQIMLARQVCIFGIGVQSAKMVRLGELVDSYRASGEKVLVYSFFLGALDRAGLVVGEHHRIDGSLAPAQRSVVIDQFLSEDGDSVLLSQIQVGGVGLNLQAASAVIILEPQWKPTTEWQAIKRAHRMGQGRTVNVHRLLAANTIEERIDSLLQRKGLTFDHYARESAISELSTSARANENVEVEILRDEQRRLEIQPDVVFSRHELSKIDPTFLGLAS